MSSTIYNHRNLQPTVQNSGLTHSAARLNECLETIKQEFDAVLHDSSVLKSQRDDYEVTSQVNELNIIRQALYDLEAQHSRIRQQYEDELLRLRNELHQARQQAHSTLNPQYPPGLGPASATAQPPLPPLQQQSAPPQQQGPPPQQPTPAPPIPPAQYPGEQQQQQQPQQQPAYPPRDRPGDRDLRDRDRERERERERERDRDMAQRDPKRIKTEKPQSSKSDQRPSEPQHPPPQQPFHSKSQSTSSQGPPPPQPPPPQQPVYEQLPPQQQQSAAPPPAAAPQQPYGDLDLDNVPAEYKKHGQDWVAVFNPRVPRVLDVSLMHTFSHESVVCCVRFSADGRYLATGCNRSAQIYDIKTGQKTHVLVDESASKTGDLYIRSVCFSPDGKYLATGAEDKQIRIWDIAKKRIRTVFEGHGQEIYSLDFSADGALIVSGSGDKTARIWEMETSNVTILSIDEPENVDAGVTSVAISPDGRFVAAGSLDTVVRIWDVHSGTLVERLQGHKDSVYSVAFTPDGKGLVSGSLDKTLKLWDVAPLYRKGVQPIVSSAAGKKEGGERGSVCLMDYKGHRDYVLSVAVSHDGQWIVSGSKDRGVQFWDARNAAVQLTLQGHKNSVISIDLSPTSGMLATGSGDSQARVWRFGPQ